MDIRVEVLAEVTEADAAAIARLIPQVSSRVESVSADLVARVAAGTGSCLVVARLDGTIVGAATLMIMTTLTGQFGHVEDVIVDDSMRGRGIGRALMEGVVAAARERDLDFVELTSRASREAANALYQSLGFRLRETNVYRLDLG